MEGRTGSHNVGGFAKPRLARQTRGSHPVEAAAALSSRRGVLSHRNGSRQTLKPTRKDGKVVSLRQTSVKFRVDPDTHMSFGGRNTSSIAQVHKQCDRRLKILLHGALFSAMFAAAMLRAVLRHRNRVILETVTKPRAAFRIQTAWRSLQQQRRIRHRAAARALLPFLRRKIGRIRAAKENCALLLQRFFRSQRERHIVHWLYKMMKRNKAIHVLRQYLKRHVARRTLAFLAVRRDERLVCEERCFIAARIIIREERVELLHILHSMNCVANATLKPLATKVMLEEELIHCTGVDRLNLPLFDVNAADGGKNCTATEMPSSADAGLCRNSLNEACVKEMVRATLTHADNSRAPALSLLAQNSVSQPLEGQLIKMPLLSSLSEVSYEQRYENVGGYTVELTNCLPSKGNSIRDSTRVSKNLATSTTWLQQQQVLFNVPNGPLNHLMEAFLGLLMRTESMERKALELDMQNHHTDLMRQINWLVITAKAMSTAPPLYAPLLLHMKDTTALRQAEQLFLREHEERLKLVEEYEAIPLRFLDRPLLNLAAEERRRGLRERLQRGVGVREEVPSPLVTTNSTAIVAGTMLSDDPAGNQPQSTVSSNSSLPLKYRVANSVVPQRNPRHDPSQRLTSLPSIGEAGKSSLSCVFLPPSDRRTQLQRLSSQNMSNVFGGSHLPEIGFSSGAVSLESTQHCTAANGIISGPDTPNDTRGNTSWDGSLLARGVATDACNDGEYPILSSLSTSHITPNKKKNSPETGPPISSSCKKNSSIVGHVQLTPALRIAVHQERRPVPAPIRVEPLPELAHVFSRESGFDYVRSSRLRHYHHLSRNDNATDAVHWSSDFKSLSSGKPLSSEGEMSPLRSRVGLISGSKRGVRRVLAGGSSVCSSPIAFGG